MTKQHFIALADAIKKHNQTLERYGKGTFTPFTADQMHTLAAACQSINPRFNRQRWLDYIAGECGPNGGAVKPREKRRGCGSPNAVCISEHIQYADGTCQAERELGQEVV